MSTTGAATLATTQRVIDGVHRNAAALRARLAEINQLAAALPGEIPTVEALRNVIVF